MPARSPNEPFAEEKQARRRRRGCCGCSAGFFLVLLALISLIAFFLLDGIFNVRSNLYYLAYTKSEMPLKIGTDDGWVSLEKISVSGTKNSTWERSKSKGFRHSTLELRREPARKKQMLASVLLDSRLHILEFSPDTFRFDVHYSRDPQTGKFHPLSAARTFRAATALAEQNQAPEICFAINLNYYTPQGQPLGLLIDNGIELNPEVAQWSGFFFVKNGTPQFGARSLFEETPGEATVAAQAFPSVMKDGQIFRYMAKDPDKYFNGTERTYRSLAGTRADGTVVFVVSGNGGVIDMKELTLIANLLEIRNATLLDGGRALQYELNCGGDRMSFNSFNNTVDDPLLSQRGFAAERPPVYLIVAPQK